MVLVTPLCTWWAWLRPARFISHCSLCPGVGQRLCLQPGFCCAVNRQIWWSRWQPRHDEDLCSPSTQRWLQTNGTHQTVAFTGWYVTSNLSFLKTMAFFGDALDGLPPISAPYLCICVFYHLDVDVVWSYCFTCREKRWHFLCVSWTYLTNGGGKNDAKCMQLFRSVVGHWPKATEWGAAFYFSWTMF